MKDFSTHCGRYEFSTSRRDFLARAAMGTGSIALASLLSREAGAAELPRANPRQARPPHFPARAKNLIMLFMTGGPSQLETFDPKPELVKHDKKPLPSSFDLDGLSFWMTHIAGRPGRWQRGIGQVLRQCPPDVFICGHSHILRIERVASLGGMLFINPGAAGRQGLHQVKTCVRLHLKDGTTQQAEVIHLDK